jgi:hypothetical protein
LRRHYAFVAAFRQAYQTRGSHANHGSSSAPSQRMDLDAADALDRRDGVTRAIRGSR